LKLCCSPDARHLISKRSRALHCIELQRSLTLQGGDKGMTAGLEVQELEVAHEGK
jgi:hypothetical protein